ncbi:MAG: DUF4293 domain-containing protein [Vicingus serpentipes]|nr:DUF4293 domain-containing protein [Vicingus serpentipes]
MIQRIQTVFLALVVILGVVFFFVPILAFTSADAIYVMNAYKTVAINDATIVIAKNMGVGVLQGIVLLLALVIIFIYKNRQLQLKLAKFNILLIAFQIAAVVMYSDVAKTAIHTATTEVSFKLGAIIPVLSLILTYLTIRFIKKDDELVRAADRLR